MNQTDMTRTARGYIRNIGPKGAAEKFYLGHDKRAAEAKRDRILALWKGIEDRHGSRPGKPAWDASTLSEAKAIAKGENPLIGKPDYEPADAYFTRVQLIGGTPALPDVYEAGRNDRLNALRDAQQGLAGPERDSSRVTGQTLYGAIAAYQAWVMVEYSASDNAKTKVDQMKTVMDYVPNCDLGDLGYKSCDEVFGTFRRRPVGKRYRKPMSRKSCSNYIGEIGRFFRWLHLSEDWNWRKPQDFSEISRTPKERDEDKEKAGEDVPTYTRVQLEILNKYATPIERVFLLLGLNCSYGADQAGRLKIGHIHLNGKVNYLKRTRIKSGVKSIHLLWNQTVEALQWALDRRESHDPGDILLLTAKALPFFRKTDGGNNCGSIPRLWGRLLQRIKKDHPKFPMLPFNSLRDTSANFIRKIAGGEIASIHLAHMHQSKDENLRRYTNEPRKIHWRAIKKLERYLASIFTAAGPEPFGKKIRATIGINKVERIGELRREGMKAPEIASTLHISQATVYRYLRGK